MQQLARGSPQFEQPRGGYEYRWHQPHHCCRGPVVQLGTEPVTSSEVPTAVRVNRSTLEPGGTGTTVTIGSADQLTLAGAPVAPVGTVPASEGNEESLAALWFWELLQRAGYEVW